MQHIPIICLNVKYDCEKHENIKSILIFKLNVSPAFPQRTARWKLKHR
jgi:hypothetical protein